ATARHAAAAALLSQNVDVATVAELRFFPFELVDADTVTGVTTDSAGLLLLKQWGFPVSEEHLRRAQSLAEVKSVVEKLLGTRESAPYAMDGAVVKVDDLGTRRLLGETERAPLWAAAWKFPPSNAATVIRDIRWSVGRTGRRSPVAIVDPVRISGVEVSRVSLNGAAEVERLGLRIGARVVVSLVGDVIPQVSAVTEAPVVPAATGAPSSPPSLPPQGCFSSSPGCNEQFLARLVHFAGREGLDVRGFGRSRLQALVRAGLVTGLPDLLLLTPDQLSKVPGIGMKTARQLAERLRIARGAPDFQVLAAIGITGVGKITIDRLARRFSSVSIMLSSSRQQLRALPPAERRGALAVSAFFASAEGGQLLGRLRELGMLSD
ncbi:MAG TPA: helix-hairpin-helix domain-containing protein, partial [Verrucomicrobiae bacterium]|nr:helix-hairpin-helix domain-containing protein [Verrucomicrobiae bacterium]